MIEHAATLMAFAKGNKAQQPNHDALMSAMREGLCSMTIRIRISNTGKDESNTWRLTPLGMRMLQMIIDQLPPHARPTAVKRRRQRPVKRQKYPPRSL